MQFLHLAALPNSALQMLKYSDKMNLSSEEMNQDEIFKENG